MREAVVVASSRTPLAKSFRGSLNRTRPDDQAAHCIRDVLRKVPQLAAEEVGDVILGCAEPAGQQGMNVARVALLRAGLPVTVPGTTVNRFCSSGLQAAEEVPGGLQVAWRVTMECEGEPKPVMVAETLSRFYADTEGRS